MKYPIFSVALGLLAVCLPGCSSPDTPANPAFFADDQPSSVRNVAHVQAATGARADATLNAQHFTADKLSGLGIAKVQMMLADNGSAFPVVVYVNLPTDDALTAARHKAVSTFLVDAGLHADQFHVTPGVNPASFHRAAPAVATLSKQDGADAKPAAVADPPASPPKK